MNIADRIQVLRRKSGMSQEELADRVGVSRQAVSKWESEQSTPDLERVIQLSELFDVSTDYLLRGIEPVKKEALSIRPPVIFAIVSTVMNTFGLLFGVITWYEEQTADALLPGAVFLALGLMLYAVARFAFADHREPGLYRVWWRINIWLVSFMPLSVFYNLLLGGVPAPYPQLHRGLTACCIFWLVYLGTGLLVMYRTRERR
ncbi:MAG: helix-turn-helix transcriptional regulator [Eubacteriales bacterium]|nr:helix-turn-helix transcriptional regulator [Eubacteriales bacterium]